MAEPINRDPGKSFEIESSWKYTDFKDQLSLAVFGNPPSLKDLPVLINTGKTGSEADRLVDITSNDPEGREHAITLKMDLNNKIVFLPDVFVGTNSKVSTQTVLREQRNRNYPQFRSSERKMMTIHSHPVDQPASPQDLSPLVLEIENGGSVAEIVATKGPNLLFLRTKETRTIPRSEKEGWVKKWTERLVADSDARLIGVQNPTKRQAVHSVVNNEVLREICQEHHLAVYSTMSGSLYKKSTL